MMQLMRCSMCLVVLLGIFEVSGVAVSRKLNIKARNFPMQILIGFFAYYIVMELIILPLLFLYNSLRLAAGVVVVVSILFTVWMLRKDKLGFLQMVKRATITPWPVIAICIVVVVAGLASLQLYIGYDTTYYVGEVNAFLYYGKFWTRDAFAGMTETSVIPLHYALSCFYPLCAVLAYLFHVDARIMMMFTIRALCVVLFSCVTYCWGYEFFTKKKREDALALENEEVEKVRQRNGALFTVISLLLCLFLMDEHSSAFMMIVRGYESKGYCAAVVAPMCTYALIMLCRNVESISNWRLLGLVAWASVPIAMSSMAVIPVAIAVVGLTLMIYHKRFLMIFKRCFLCVLPNMIFMAWYVIRTY